MREGETEDGRDEGDRCCGAEEFPAGPGDRPRPVRAAAGGPAMAVIGSRRGELP